MCERQMTWDELAKENGELKREVWRLQETCVDHVEISNHWQQRAEAAEAWKREQLEVEASWDVQAIGKLIGCGLGQAIHPHIQPTIEKLQAELAAARQVIARERRSDASL